MLLARSGKEKFLGAGIAAETQRGVFLKNAVNGDANAVFVRAGFGLDGEGDRWLRNARIRMKNWGGFISQGVAGESVLELGDGAEIAGVEFLDGNGGFALHQLNVLKAFLAAAIEIGEMGVIFQNAAEDLEVADASGEGIGKGFINVNGQRFGVGNF